MFRSQVAGTVVRGRAVGSVVPRVEFNVEPQAVQLDALHTPVISIVFTRETV